MADQYGSGHSKGSGGSIPDGTQRGEAHEESSDGINEGTATGPAYSGPTGETGDYAPDPVRVDTPTSFTGVTGVERRALAGAGVELPEVGVTVPDRARGGSAGVPARSGVEPPAVDPPDIPAGARTGAPTTDSVGSGDGVGDAVGDAIGDAVGEIGNRSEVPGVADPAVDRVQDAVGDAADYASGVVDDAVDAGSDAVESVADPIADRVPEPSGAEVGDGYGDTPVSDLGTVDARGEATREIGGTIGQLPGADIAEWGIENPDAAVDAVRERVPEPSGAEAGDGYGGGETSGLGTVGGSVSGAAETIDAVRERVPEPSGADVGGGYGGTVDIGTTPEGDISDEIDAVRSRVPEPQGAEVGDGYGGGETSGLGTTGGSVSAAAETVDAVRSRVPEPQGAEVGDGYGGGETSSLGTVGAGEETTWELVGGEEGAFGEEGVSPAARMAYDDPAAIEARAEQEQEILSWRDADAVGDIPAAAAGASFGFGQEIERAGVEAGATVSGAIRSVNPVSGMGPTVGEESVGSVPGNVVGGGLAFGGSAVGAGFQLPGSTAADVATTQEGDQTPSEIQGGTLATTDEFAETQGEMVADYPLSTAAGFAMPSVTGSAAGLRGYRATRATEGRVRWDEITTERGERGVSPEFDTDTNAPTSEAIGELETRRGDQPDTITDQTGGEGVLFHTTSARFDADLQIGEGASEYPGLFATPEASPLGLSRVEGADYDAGPSIGFGDLSTTPEQAPGFRPRGFEAMPGRAAEPGYAVRNQGELVETGLSRGDANALAEDVGGDRVPDPTTRGYEYMSEEAPTETGVVRPPGDRTPEMEAIFAPDSGFTQTSAVGVEMPDGRVVRSPLYEPDGAAARGGETARAADDAGAVETGAEIASSTARSRSTQPDVAVESVLGPIGGVGSQRVGGGDVDSDSRRTPPRETSDPIDAASSRRVGRADDPGASASARSDRSRTADPRDPPVSGGADGGSPRSRGGGRDSRPPFGGSGSGVGGGSSDPSSPSSRSGGLGSSIGGAVSGSGSPTGSSGLGSTTSSVGESSSPTGSSGLGSTTSSVGESSSPTGSSGLGSSLGGPTITPGPDPDPRPRRRSGDLGGDDGDDPVLPGLTAAGRDFGSGIASAEDVADGDPFAASHLGF